MYTALRATSHTLAAYLRGLLVTDPSLAAFFDSAHGGSMVVSLDSPERMAANSLEGLSVWLYRLTRDEETLNAPPTRIGLHRLLRTPLPVRLHYLVTPVTTTTALTDPETEQVVLGKVLQAFHDHPTLRGTDLKDELGGTTVELTVRLEPMHLEEITQVWDALEGSYRLSISYEVGVVAITSGLEPESIAPVEVVIPEYAVMTGS